MTNSDEPYIAFIFCRGGSKGVPKKNIRLVGGKPLLAWSVECAKKSSHIGRVVVSTDDQEISEVAERFGAEVLQRPKKLATDSAAELDAWKHAISVYSDRLNDCFISVPATSPLRETEDIDAAIIRFKRNDCDIVFSVSESHRSPYLNMVERDEKDFINIILKDETVYRRQDTPQVFDITTCVYVGTPKYIAACNHLMEGSVASVEIPAHRSLDIDNMYDLHMAELLLQNPFVEKPR